MNLKSKKKFTFEIEESIHFFVFGILTFFCFRMCVKKKENEDTQNTKSSQIMSTNLRQF